MEFDMFERVTSKDDIISQLLVARQMLSDITARLVREACKPKSMAEIQWPDDPWPCSFGYTNSLEMLIRQGRQYGTIFADPPWPHDGPPDPRWRHRPRFSVDAIASLPIAQLAAPSSHLHIWTPDRYLHDAVQIIEKWGFTYKGSLIWLTPEVIASDYWGIGHKYLLLGVRGNAPFANHRPRSWFFDMSRSLKCDGTPYDIELMVKRMSPFPRLNLFCEGVQEGWTTWGDRVPDYGQCDEDDLPPELIPDWRVVGPSTQDGEAQRDANGDEEDNATEPLIFDSSNEEPVNEVVGFDEWRILAKSFKSNQEKEDVHPPKPG